MIKRLLSKDINKRQPSTGDDDNNNNNNNNNTINNNNNDKNNNNNNNNNDNNNNNNDDNNNNKNNVKSSKNTTLNRKNINKGKDKDDSRSIVSRNKNIKKLSRSSNHQHCQSLPPPSPTPSIGGGERKLISRNAVICSSGKDKYRHDSERAEQPKRPVSSELEYVPVLPSSSSINNLTVNSPIHASRLSMYSSSDFVSISSIPPKLSRQNSNVSQVVKRNTVVNRLTLQSSVNVGGRFQNPWPNYRLPTFTNILKLGFSHDKSNVPSKKELNQHLPILEPNISQKPPPNTFRITWLGHATVLAEFDNMSILTDPMFSERASPSQMFGPKRYRDPPCTIHDLPSNLDAVIISHSHYDHLDLNSVVLLNARYGNDLRWFIPLGLGDWISRLGCENVIELDWWEENCVPDKSDVSFFFTPAQHWSKRTLTDDNKSLWGSWAIKGPKFRFFFAGDTGFCDVFKQIGLMYGPFDIAAIPIGSYEPRKQMKYQHINPTEAVQLHKDLRSKFSIGIHWGTFAYSNEHFLDPQTKLRIETEKARISHKKFTTFMHGETRIIHPDGQIESTQQNKISLSS